MGLGVIPVEDGIQKNFGIIPEINLEDLIKRLWKVPLNSWLSSVVFKK